MILVRPAFVCLADDAMDDATGRAAGRARASRIRQITLDDTLAVREAVCVGGALEHA